MIEYIAILIGIIVICVAILTYRVVPPSSAHVVVTPTKKMVVSSDERVQRNGGKTTYFAIPSWVPFVGRTIRIMNLTIKNVDDTQETFEKDLARFLAKWSLKYRIEDVLRASETFEDDETLDKQLRTEIHSAVRDVTSQYDVNTIRAKKGEISNKVEEVLKQTFEKWGLVLTSFAVVDLDDTEESKIISNISRRREVEIESLTRQQNAEKFKEARLREAEADQIATIRETERDEQTAKRDQEKTAKVAEFEKLAQEKHFEVVKTQTIKQAEINKEQAIVLANQQKEVEAINKDKKELDGQGERLRLEQVAKGNAASILESGLAEAKAKDALQAALNKFGDAAIRALVAEKVVAKDRDIGIAGAQALSDADLKVFVGNGSGAEGFEIGKLISAVQVSNVSAADALVNRIGQPNDLGFSKLAKAEAEAVKDSALKKAEKK